MAEISLSKATALTASLDAAISNALANEVANAIKDEISLSAERNVYAYQASPFFMKTRRKASGGLMDKDNLVSRVEGNVLTVENVTPLQALWGHGHEEVLTRVVEYGSKSFHQPYPRPFMEKAKTELIDKGRAAAALRMGLRRQGIDVEGLEFKFE